MAMGMLTSHREAIDVFEVLVYHREEDASIVHPLTQAIPLIPSPHRTTPNASTLRNDAL